MSDSLIVGATEMREMLDFCAKHGIVADIQMIAAQKVDEALRKLWTRMVGLLDA